MLKIGKLKNSTILFIGILTITLGISTGLYDYFKERKDKTFSSMNIMLYENEQPNNIENSPIIEEENNSNDLIGQESHEQLENNNTNQNIIDTTQNYLGVIEIPKLNLKNGFYGLESKYNNVDSNVTLIKGSTFPDQEKNNLILAAHSGNCSYCFFDKLYKLKLGDIAFIHYKNVKYQYKIVNVYEVEKDGTVAIYRDYNKSTLTLITCTRNSKTKQTVYILEKVD